MVTGKIDLAGQGIDFNYLNHRNLIFTWTRTAGMVANDENDKNLDSFPHFYNFTS